MAPSSIDPYAPVQRSLAAAQAHWADAISKAAAGRSVRNASDDAAAFSIGTRLETLTRSYGVVHSNLGNAQALTATADGALSQTSASLSRIRDLALQAADADPAGRAAIGQEINQQLAQINQVANTTVFGSRKLLDGSEPSLTFTTGTSSSDLTNINLPTATTAALGLDSVSASVASGDLKASLDAIDAAAGSVTSARGSLGASQNAFASAQTRADNAAENLTRAYDQTVGATLGAQIMAASLAANQFRAATAVYGQISRMGVSPVSAMSGSTRK